MQQDNLELCLFHIHIAGTLQLRFSLPFSGINLVAPLKTSIEVYQIAGGETN